MGSALSSSFLRRRCTELLCLVNVPLHLNLRWFSNNQKTTEMHTVRFWLHSMDSAKKGIQADARKLKSNTSYVMVAGARGCCGLWGGANMTPPQFAGEQHERELVRYTDSWTYKCNSPRPCYMRDHGFGFLKTRLILQKRLLAEQEQCKRHGTID